MRQAAYDSIKSMCGRIGWETFWTETPETLKLFTYQKSNVVGGPCWRRLPVWSGMSQEEWERVEFGPIIAFGSA